MTAQYWTTNGVDIWRVKERRLFDFTNLDTGEVVTCDSDSDVMGKKFLPVTMPDIKPQKGKTVKTEYNIQPKKSSLDSLAKIQVQRC